MLRQDIQETSGKVFVGVTLYVDECGAVHPRELVWEDGTRYAIDRVLRVCQAASLKAGGQGVRYTCRIGGRQAFLFCDHGRWFVERKRV